MPYVPILERSTFSMKSFFKKLWRILLKICLWFFILSIVSTVLFRWIPVPVTPLMLIRCVQQAVDDTRDVILKKDWVSIEEISLDLQLAVVCAEDQNFLEHYGFDFDAIEKVVKHNKSHKRKRGASTISQQTAKNVFLYDGRNWVRKGLEVYFTFLAELFWSKKRIMEVYLNVIEFGDGIYGAEAAAQEFFHTSAKKLSRQQAALLAAVLPNPRKFSVKNPSAYVRKRQNWIIGQMNNLGGELKFDSSSSEK